MLDQFITNTEQRKRCVEVIRQLPDPNTGLLLIVRGDVASYKACFTRALADVLQENGKRVKIVDVAFEHAEVAREDVVDVKEGGVVIYETDANASIKFPDDESLKRRTTMLHLEGYFLGSFPSGIEKLLKQDIRSIYTSSVYIVVHVDNATTPLAICRTRKEAIEMAECVVKDDWNGQRHIQVLKTFLNHRIERGEMPGDLCWDALTADCEDC